MGEKKGQSRLGRGLPRLVQSPFVASPYSEVKSKHRQCLTSTSKCSSSSCHLELWVESFKFCTGFSCGELPVYGFVCVVSLAVPLARLPLEGSHVGNAPVEALSGEHAEFDLGDVEPASVFWGVVDLEAVEQAARFVGREGAVE